jgi:hypothetical protein
MVLAFDEATQVLTLHVVILRSNGHLSLFAFSYQQLDSRFQSSEFSSLLTNAYRI